MREIRLPCYASGHVCVDSGLWNGVRAVSFPRDPDNSTFEFLKPGEVWRFTGTALQRMSRLVVSKGTKGDCLRVLGLRAQGQE